MSDPDALLRRASAAEQAGDIRAAVVLYGDGVRALLGKLRRTTDPAERESLQRQADGHFDHAVSLKQQLQHAAGAPPAAPMVARQQQVCVNSLRMAGAVRAFGRGSVSSMVPSKEPASSEPVPAFASEPEPEPESEPEPEPTDSARRRAECVSAEDRTRREQLELQRNRVDVLGKLCESFSQTSHRHTDTSLRRVLSWSGGTVATAWQYMQEWEQELSNSHRATDKTLSPGGNAAAAARSVQESTINRLATPSQSPARTRRRGTTPQRASGVLNSSDDDSDCGVGRAEGVALRRCSRCMYAAYTAEDSRVCYCAQPAAAWEDGGTDGLQEPVLQTVAMQRATTGRRSQQTALTGPRGSRKVVNRSSTSTATRGKTSASTRTRGKMPSSTAAWNSEVRRVQMQPRENQNAHKIACTNTSNKSVRPKSSGARSSRSFTATPAGNMGSPRRVSSASRGARRSARKTKRDQNAGSSMIDRRVFCAAASGSLSTSAQMVAAEALLVPSSPATSETGSVPRRETHNYASMSVGPKFRLDNLLREYQPPACPA
eukprot:COSAG02_NODE_59_length_43585_cov_39.087752_13_plen_546_part_00